MKRLVPWLLCLLLAAFCLRLYLNLQRMETVAAAQKQSTNVGEAADTPPQIPAETVGQSEPDRSARSELLKLRNEVHQLRETKAELEKEVASKSERISRLEIERGKGMNETRTMSQIIQSEVPKDKLGMIGASFTYVNNQSICQTIMENSPAARAGLKARDIIVSINGINTSQMKLAEVVDAVRGEEGSQLTLEVGDGVNETRQVTLTRERWNEKWTPPR